MEISTVTPGEQLVHRIFGLPNTIGEKVLNLIARPPANRGSTHYPRKAGEWEEAVCEVGVLVGEEERHFTLIKGPFAPSEGQRGLEIQEVPGRHLTVKMYWENDRYVLKVGRDVLDRLPWLANELMAVCSRGNGWMDRRGGRYAKPYGPDLDPRSRSGRRVLAKQKRHTAGA